MFDAELSMCEHVSRSMFFHLHRLRPLCARLDHDVTLSLVILLVILRLDYCNCVLAGLPRDYSGTVAKDSSCSCSARKWSASARPRDVNTLGVALVADQATGRL